MSSLNYDLAAAYARRMGVQVSSDSSLAFLRRKIEGFFLRREVSVFYPLFVPDDAAARSVGPEVCLQIRRTAPEATDSPAAGADAVADSPETTQGRDSTRARRSRKGRATGRR